MKKLFRQLRCKYRLISVANVLAIAALIGSVNTTCAWLHHQPEVPEAAKKFRKF